MANVLFGYPIYSDAGNVTTPTLSGGSWETALPLTNLQDARLHRVARTTDDSRFSSIIKADLGASRAVRVVALVNHNLSSVDPANGSNANVRVRGFASPPILDAGGDGYQPFVTGWTATGTPTRSANTSFTTGGIYLDTIGDDDGTNAEFYSRNIAFTGNGEKCITLLVKQGTASSSVVRLRDNTAVADRLLIGIAWSAGAPVFTQSVGVVLSSTQVGTGIYRVAMRTTTATAANTNTLIIYPAENVGIVGTLTGTTEFGDIQAYNPDYDVLVYDSGMTDKLPDGTDTDDRAEWTPTYAHVMPSDQTARYWQVNINDDNNPDGYIQVGRLVIAGGIQPEVNASYGARLGFTTTSTRIETDGGAFITSDRKRRREATVLLEMLTEAEAFGPLWRMQRRAGLANQLFFVFDPDDTTLLWERAFLGYLRELSAVEFPYPTYHATPFAITEAL